MIPKTLFRSFGVGATTLLLLGCGGSGNPFGGGGAGVGDNPRGIVAWANIQGKSNVAATMRVNDAGTTVTEIPATILTAQVDSINLGGRIENNVEDLYCQPGNGRGVYEGDSGTPVLVGGKIAGGLFGSSDNVHFDARGIQQEEATASGPAKRQMLKGTPLHTRFFQCSKGTIPLLGSKQALGKPVYVGVVSPLPTKWTLADGTSTVSPIAGRRFASPFVIGPDIVGFDEATYTLQTPDGLWVATAHGLEDLGPVSWPIMSVSVDGPSSDGSVHAHVIGSIYGTLTYDGQNGSLIDASAAPTMMTAEVDTTLNSVPQSPVTHYVRFERGSSTEDQGVELAAQATAQDQLQGLSGTFTTSGTATLTYSSGQMAVDGFSIGSSSSSVLVSNLGSRLGSILVSENDAHSGQQLVAIVIRLSIQ